MRCTKCVGRWRCGPQVRGARRGQPRKRRPHAQCAGRCVRNMRSGFRRRLSAGCVAADAGLAFIAGFCKEATAARSNDACPFNRHAPSHSNVAQQHQYHDDDDDQPEGARWPVTPASTVRPCRKCSDQQQNQNDDKDCTEHRTPPELVRHNGACGRNSRAASRRREPATAHRLNTVNSCDEYHPIQKINFKNANPVAMLIHRFPPQAGMQWLNFFWCGTGRRRSARTITTGCPRPATSRASGSASTSRGRA
ncbi:hypothetical protein BDI4_120159 [Burkholderia diffusa]|nr:hypothetical protein BDI4_120159 [Burkholderia diffusa]